MSDRKLFINGALTEYSFDKTKKYRYNKQGTLEEITEQNKTDTDIVISGSKSSLRRIADIEQNISVLTTTLLTATSTGTYESDDENYLSIIDRPTRVKSIYAFAPSSNVIFNNSNVTFGSAMTNAVKDAVLPSGGSNGQVLTTDGSGNLTWTTVSGGSSSPATYNTAGTLIGSTTNNNNTTLGYQAGQYYSSGNQNTYIGVNAGRGVSSYTSSFNTVVGSNAARLMTTGNTNTAVGQGALQFNSTGSSNLAFGRNALGSGTAPNECVALGNDSLKNCDTGKYNTGVGSQSGKNSNGWYNIYIGKESGVNHTTGNDNTIIGTNAASILESGAHNIIIGRLAEPSGNAVSNEMTLGYTNIDRLRIPGLGLDTNDATDGQVLGWNSGQFVWTTPSVGGGGSASSATVLTEGTVFGVTSSTTTSTALGYNAGGNQTGIDNTFIGHWTGAGSAGSSTGNQQTAIGYEALKNVTTGTENTAIGWRALHGATSGKWNTAIGRLALYRQYTAYGSVAIGHNAGLNSNGNDNISIGRNTMAWGTLTGVWNSGIGVESMTNLSGSSSTNTAIGPFTLGSATDNAHENTAIGVNAGNNLVQGRRNTFIGAYSAFNAVGYCDNVTVIGYYAEPSSNTASHEITIGNNSINRLRIPGIGFDTADAQNNQYLAWDSTAGTMTWTTPPGGVTTLVELTDVSGSGSAGQVLTADGAGNFSFTSLADTTLALDANGDSVSGNFASLNKWLLNPNPEEALSFTPYQVNDLAFIRQKGSTYTATGFTLADWQFDLMFNGTASTFDIPGTTLPQGTTDEGVLEFTVPSTVNLTYGTYLGIAFGAKWNRFQRVKLEAKKNGVWYTALDVTDNAKDVVMGIAIGTGNAVTDIRVTVGNPAFSGGGRISHIFAVDYNSPLQTSLFPTRMGGDFYNDLFVNGNKVWHAGNDGSGSGLDADLLDGYSSSSYIGPSNNVHNSTYFALKGNSQYDVVFSMMKDPDGTPTTSRLYLSDGILYFQVGGAGAGSTTSSGTLRFTGYNGTDIGALTVKKDGADRDILHAGMYGASGAWYSGGNKIPYVNGSGVMEIGKYIDFHDGATSTNDYDARIQIASGNLEMVGIGSLYVAGSKVWTQGNDGTGSGLDADLLDGKQASEFALKTELPNTSSFLTNTAPINMNRNMIEGAILSPTPEQSLTFTPYLVNDWGFARQRGGTISLISYGAATTTSISNSAFDAMFDPKASTMGINCANCVDESTAFVFEVTMPNTLYYSQFAGISFGAQWNRAKGVRLEVWSNANSVWETVIYETNNASDVCFAKVNSSGSIQGTKVRVSLWSPASGNTIRVAHIFAYDYDSELATTMFVDRTGGTVYGTITQTSDIRWKSNVAVITNALEKVDAIRGVTFTSDIDEKEHVGVIAQEVETVLPQLVDTDEQTGMKSVAYSNMVGLLVEAIKELRSEVQTLRQEIADLRDSQP